MYVPPSFNQTDLARIRDFIREARIATLITNGPTGLFASHLPMMLLDDPAPNGTLLCHISRANDQWKHVGDAMAVFVGTNAYLSPSFYPSKADDPRQVPTWNYVAVHAHGSLRAIEDADELLALVTRLTNLHESTRTEPWAVDDAPPNYIRSQLKGIVGLEMRIERFDAKWKLSQNRSAVDVGGAIDGLRASEDPIDRTTADAMADAERRASR